MTHFQSHSHGLILDKKIKTSLWVTMATPRLYRRSYNQRSLQAVKDWIISEKTKLSTSKAPYAQMFPKILSNYLKHNLKNKKYLHK